MISHTFIFTKESLRKIIKTGDAGMPFYRYFFETGPKVGDNWEGRGTAFVQCTLDGLYE